MDLMKSAGSFECLPQIQNGLGESYITILDKMSKFLRSTVNQRSQNPASETISSTRKHILSIMKKISYYETFVDFVECNISRNVYVA